MKCLFLATLLAVATTLPVQSREFENPNDTRYPCQMVQVLRPTGWGPPFKPSKARTIVQETGRQHRTVRMESTRVYLPKHVPPIIGCLTHRKFAVSVSKARSVASCESSFGPLAYNPAGPYLGVYQMTPGFYQSNNPHGSPPWQNAYANVYAALRSAAKGGWGPWGCA